MQTKEKKCIDLVQSQYDYTLNQFKEAYQYFNQDEELREPNEELEHCEDFCQYISEYGLCFDKVEPNTFQDQKLGYWRWQLSWGGPSDEFRLYSDGTIYYHFMDWYDGAKRYITDNDLVSYMLNMKTFP